MSRAKITSKGQITIPKQLRENLGLNPGDEVEFVLDGTTYRIRKVPRENPFDAWVGFATHLKGWTTDEFMDEIRGPRLDNGD